MSPETIAEAAFQIYWRFIREPDEQRARVRFNKLNERARQEWEGDAKAALRIGEIYNS